MRGYIPASRVQFKSLGDRMGSYGHGGLQYHAKGYSDTQGAAPWSVVLEGHGWYLVPCI